MSHKLGTALINGQVVSFFAPPHKDGPWVDVKELAGAFLRPEAASRKVQRSQHFSEEGEQRAVTVARNGDDIATIMCQAMPQGLCGPIDQWNGFKPADDEERGPAHWAYRILIGQFAAEHWPLSFEGIIHAFQNPGGHYKKGLRDE